jgi:hypothetical protein
MTMIPQFSNFLKADNIYSLFIDGFSNLRKLIILVVFLITMQIKYTYHKEDGAIEEDELNVF